MDYRKELIKALEKTGLGAKAIEEALEQPQKREMGDYALPCFRFAKEMKKAPNQIAVDIAKQIKPPKSFSRMEVKGPYINFFLDDSMLAANTIEEILTEKEKYGLAKKSGELTAVEYCQANPMKAFHIGHVRNICMGESTARLLDACGTKVMRVNYGGDVGPHVSKTIYAYQELWKGKEPKEIHEKGKWLGELYAAGAKAVKDNPELEQKMRDMVVQLEQGDKRLVKDWEKLRKESLEYFDSIYRDLNVKFDRIVLESEVEKEGIKIAKELLKEGFAEKDEGAVLVDLTKYNLEKFLILKSDGAALYSSKDLALAKMKKEKLKAKKTFVIVGSEQRFYFQQLIKTIELLNKRKKEFCDTTSLHYELVRLEGGKMASREGNVITYSELFNTIFEKTLAETTERHKDWSEKKINETAKELALTSIKFGMLVHDKNKVIVFNWEKATSLEGETGPFVQYSYARAQSILRKAGKIKEPKKYELTHAKEHELLSLLSAYKDKVREANQTNSPHKMAHYLLELASTFNSFYHEVPVLQAEETLKNARINLVKSAAQVLENGLKLLNITPLNEM